jgi:hypothetical protein
MGTHTIFLSHCAFDEQKAPAYAEASARRQSSRKTVMPACPARCAAGQTIGDDIYPVRNNALLFCSPAGGGVTF